MDPSVGFSTLWKSLSTWRRKRAYVRPDFWPYYERRGTFYTAR